MNASPTIDTARLPMLLTQLRLPTVGRPGETYLKLAPTGQYADTAKAIVASIK